MTSVTNFTIEVIQDQFKSELYTIRLKVDVTNEMTIDFVTFNDINIIKDIVLKFADNNLLTGATGIYDVVFNQVFYFGFEKDLSIEFKNGVVRIEIYTQSANGSSGVLNINVNNDVYLEMKTFKESLEDMIATYDSELSVALDTFNTAVLASDFIEIKRQQLLNKSLVYDWPTKIAELVAANDTANLKLLVDNRIINTRNEFLGIR